MLAEANQVMLWPYDEVKASRGHGPSQFTISAPWLTISSQIEESNRERAFRLLGKMESGDLTLEDRFDVTWLFRSFMAYPFAYFLPRGHLEQSQLDQPALIDSSLLTGTIAEIISEKLQQEIPSLQSQPWTWNTEAALQLSFVPSGYDPFSLLSVSRRYHLLDSIEQNPLSSLFEVVTRLIENGEKESIHHACTLLVRQNHYVTQQCQPSLAPAIEIAGQAREHVQEFMDSERGHDRILQKALTSMGVEPESILVTPAAIALMEGLKFCASRNLLAFAMAVDIFERSSYTEQDPLAALLEKAGYTVAARQINAHKNINDHGEHENVSLEILEFMGPVSEAYATEALRLAEVISHLVHAVSLQTLEQVKTRNRIRRKA